MGAHEQDRVWEFVAAPRPRSRRGVPHVLQHHADVARDIAETDYGASSVGDYRGEPLPA